MYSKIIAAVVLSAVLGAPAVAGETISHSHSDCYRGKCATVTHSHGAMAGSSHGAMSTHGTSNIATKPH